MSALAFTEPPLISTFTLEALLKISNAAPRLDVIEPPFIINVELLHSFTGYVLLLAPVPWEIVQCCLLYTSCVLNLTGEGKIYEEEPYFGPVMMYGTGTVQADYTVVNVGSDVTLEGWSGPVSYTHLAG